MADFIAFLTVLGYIVWLLSAVTKAFHFSGMTSPIFGTVLILFLHTDYAGSFPTWILWFFTVSIIWKIIRIISQAEKPIYILSGFPREEESDE